MAASAIGLTGPFHPLRPLRIPEKLVLPSRILPQLG